MHKSVTIEYDNGVRTTYPMTVSSKLPPGWVLIEYDNNTADVCCGGTQYAALERTFWTRRWREVGTRDPTFKTPEELVCIIAKRHTPQARPLAF